MFEFLANLIHLEPAVDGEVLMGIGGIGAAIISSIIPAIIGKLGGGSGGGASAAQNQGAQAQADALQQQTRLRANLEAMFREAAEGGRPPHIPLDLRNPADFESLLADTNFLPLENQLLKLLGGSLGTGAIDSAARSDQIGQLERERQASQIARSLLNALTNRQQPEVPITPAPNTPGNQGVVVTPGGPTQGLF